jgi:hypothetical protein
MVLLVAKVSLHHTHIHSNTHTQMVLLHLLMAVELVLGSLIKEPLS